MTDLIDETIRKADIREIKLTNGQTLIAEIMGVHENQLVMYEPYIVDHTNASGTAIFRKWFFGAEEGMQYLKESAILSFAKCNEDVKRAYIRNSIEENMMDHAEDDPDNEEFYLSTPHEQDIVH